MRTVTEIREWLAELNDETPTSPQQQVAVRAAADTLKWVLTTNPITPGGNA